MNQVATIFSYPLTFDEILDLPRQFTNPATCPILIRYTQAIQPDHWTIPLNDEYSTLYQQWQAEACLHLESVDERIVLVVLKTYCIVDGWLSFERFLNGGPEWHTSRETYRALCREVADRLGVSRVLHTGFSEIPWYTLETQTLDIEGLAEIIMPNCPCVIDDFETFSVFPSTYVLGADVPRPFPKGQTPQSNG